MSLSPVPAPPLTLAAVDALLTASGLPPTDPGSAPADYRIVTEAGGLVGCVGVETWGRWGLLRSLAVAPAARGTGVGGRLADAAEALARDRGLDALYLLTTTADAFFQARGYRPADRQAVPEAVRQSSEFRDVCPATARCWVKALSP